jgi:hypothetical protein
VAAVTFEPCGFKCPKCGIEVVNPKAVHGRDENGDRVWKNIIQGALIRLCAEQGLLTCTCGHPENNHFDHGVHPCAHCKCLSYNERARVGKLL